MYIRKLAIKESEFDVPFATVRSCPKRYATAAEKAPCIIIFHFFVYSRILSVFVLAPIVSIASECLYIYA